MDAVSRAVTNDAPIDVFRVATRDAPPCETGLSRANQVHVKPKSCETHKFTQKAGEKH